MTVVKRRGKRFLRLRWRDEDGQLHERSAGTARRRDAEREAADLEHDLTAGLVDEARLTWDEFRSRYTDEHLNQQARKTRTGFNTAANHLERFEKRLERLAEVNTPMISRYAANLAKEGKPPTTIASYMRSLRSAMNWAEKQGYLPRAPRFTMPKRSKGINRDMRSRPITRAELEKCLDAAEQVRPRDFTRWQRLLLGLWESGLRISELIELSWDRSSLLSVDTSQAIPVIRILAEGEKAHRDRFQPMTPEFWKLIRVPKAKRRGHLFPLPGRKSKQMTAGRAIRVVSDIGKAAGVITEEGSGKHATSHDMGRRPFTDRIAKHLSQANLAKWMRHESPETTMRYYHAPEVQSLAAQAWTEEDLKSI